MVVDCMLVEEVVVFFLRLVPPVLVFLDTVVRSSVVGWCWCWCRGRLVVRIDSERVGKSVSIVVVVVVAGLKNGIIKFNIPKILLLNFEFLGCFYFFESK